MKWDESDEFVFISESPINLTLTYIFLSGVAVLSFILAITAVGNGQFILFVVLLIVSILSTIALIRQIKVANSDDLDQIIIGIDGIEIENEFIQWEEIQNEHCMDVRFNAGLDNRFLCLEVGGEPREYKVGHMEADTDEFNEIMSFYRMKWNTVTDK